MFEICYLDRAGYLIGANFLYVLLIGVGRTLGYGVKGSKDVIWKATKSQVICRQWAVLNRIMQDRNYLLCEGFYGGHDAEGMQDVWRARLIVFACMSIKSHSERFDQEVVGLGATFLVRAFAVRVVVQCRPP